MKEFFEAKLNRVSPLDPLNRTLLTVERLFSRILYRISGVRFVSERHLREIIQLLLQVKSLNVRFHTMMHRMTNFFVL